MNKTSPFLLLLAALYANNASAGEVEWKEYIEAGRTAWEQGNYRGAVAKAEAAIKEAQEFGPEDIRLLTAEWYVARARGALGEYAEAEKIFRRLLEIGEKKYGANNEHVAHILKGLASIFKRQGRQVEAATLYQRAIAIQEQTIGVDHPDFAESLYSLAGVYQGLGKLSEAEQFLIRAIEIAEKKLGTDDPRIARGRSSLAWIYSLQNRDAEAEKIAIRALEQSEKEYGAEHPQMAHPLGVLSWLRIKEKRFDEAELLYKRILSIDFKVYGADHPVTAGALYNLAYLHYRQGNIESGLKAARVATSIISERLVTRAFDTRRGLLGEQRSKSHNLEQHILLLLAQGFAQPEARRLYHEEAFAVSQLARTSDTAEQLALMAARYATNDDALAQLVRQRQDFAAKWEQTDTQLISEASKPEQNRNLNRESELRTSLNRVGSELSELDKRIAKEFPQYAELTNPKPLRLDSVRKLLSPDEALIVYVSTFDGCFMWVIRGNGGSFSRLPITRAALDNAVRRLRGHLDSNIVDPERILAKPFNIELAHTLYQQILAHAEPQLAGINHLIVVPDGPLQSLPLSVLVTAPSGKPINSISDHANVAWLAKKYAITTLPSVGALRALREFAKAPLAKESFSGFGDPILDGQGAGERKAKVSTFFPRGAIADVNEVRKLERLPETADELKAIAIALKANEASLFLGNRATETQVKHLDLHKFRTLAFATHGLMTGEFKGLAEPALVLTPPPVGTEQDDGLLTTSEIARLKLNADWVILSACNTAAADGTPGAEGFSGLAKAFFYAGARSLLVSHWPVPSESTVALTTEMFSEHAKGTPKAEALRRSMLKLMRRKDKPQFAHPMFWAPFVVVGEGKADWAVR